MPELDPPLPSDSGVTRTLLAWSLGILLTVVGAIWALDQKQHSDEADRILRLEATINARGERLATLESGRAENAAAIHGLDARTGVLESRVSSLEISLAAHRAATEYGGRSAR